MTTTTATMMRIILSAPPELCAGGYAFCGGYPVAIGGTLATGGAATTVGWGAAAAAIGAPQALQKPVVDERGAPHLVQKPAIGFSLRLIPAMGLPARGNWLARRAMRVPKGKVCVNRSLLRGLRVALLLWSSQPGVHLRFSGGQVALESRRCHHVAED